MAFAYRKCGRTHEEVEQTTENAVVLPEGQRMIGILWNGGWDDYIVDLNDVIDSHESNIQGNARYWPDIKGEGKYLRGSFSRKLDSSKSYRIIDKIGSGG